jgi:drug/metabolite transporter (DMT)-like permease
MKKHMSINKIIGIVVFLVGVVVLALGVYNLVSFNSSIGGKFLNWAAGHAGRQTETVRNSIIQIVIGAACAAAGCIVYKKK